MVCPVHFLPLSHRPRPPGRDKRQGGTEYVPHKVHVSESRFLVSPVTPGVPPVLGRVLFVLLKSMTIYDVTFGLSSYSLNSVPSGVTDPSVLPTKLLHCKVDSTLVTWSVRFVLLVPPSTFTDYPLPPELRSHPPSPLRRTLSLEVRLLLSFPGSTSPLLRPSPLQGT